jgi:transposase
MTNQQKRELAEILYVRGGITHQGELADRVGVRPATISKWKAKFEWDRLARPLLATRQQQLTHLYEQLEELTNAIRAKEEGKRYADSKQGDIYAKLTSAIQKLEIDLSIQEIVDVMMRFNEFIAKVDVEHAQLILDYQDSFIKSRL